MKGSRKQKSTDEQVAAKTYKKRMIGLYQARKTYREAQDAAWKAYDAYQAAIKTAAKAICDQATAAIAATKRRMK